MFNLAIDSKLRGCDLVKLRVADIHLGDSVRLRTTVVQQKTGRPVPLGADRADPGLPDRMAEEAGTTFGRLAVPSRRHPADHVTTRQYSRLAATGAGRVNTTW